jgi:hypothetical protein
MGDLGGMIRLVGIQATYSLLSESLSFFHYLEINGK